MEFYPNRFFLRQEDIDKNQKSKKSSGAYFTPMPIVHFINKSVDLILKSQFKLSNGLGESNLKILDYAMGSGIFLFDIIHKALDNEANKEDIINKFYGFELDKESYDVAYDNISELTGAKPKSYLISML